MSREVFLKKPGDKPALLNGYKNLDSGLKANQYSKSLRSGAKASRPLRQRMCSFCEAETLAFMPVLTVG